MAKKRSRLYMRLDRFKQVSGASAPKARTMGVGAKIAVTYRSGRILWGVIMIAVFCWLAGEYLFTRDVEPKCWFCSASDRASVPGIITKMDCIAYGAKNRNDYRVEYSYMVNGRTYTGVGYQTGLLYLEKHAVTVDYMVKDPSCSCVREMRCAADNALFTIMFGGVLLAIALFLVQGGARRLANAIWVIEHGVLATATVKSVTERRIHTWYNRPFHRTSIWAATCVFADSSGANHKLEVNVDKGSRDKGDRLDVVYDPGMPTNAIAVGALPRFVRTEPPLG
jgi:hypothetical protein